MFTRNLKKKQCFTLVSLCFMAPLCTAKLIACRTNNNKKVLSLKSWFCIDMILRWSFYVLYYTIYVLYYTMFYVGFFMFYAALLHLQLAVKK